MFYLSEPLDWPGADPLCRAVGYDQLGVFCFKPGELLQQPVVLEVADLRCGLDVVFPVVTANFIAQPDDF